MGQWFPDSKVHRDSGQQSDSGRSLRLSQVLRESRVPICRAAPEWGGCTEGWNPAAPELLEAPKGAEEGEEEGDVR